MIQALGQYTPNQTRAQLNKTLSLQTGHLSSSQTQATPQFGSDLGEGYGIALKLMGAAALAAVAGALGIGYLIGKSNSPQPPVQPAPTVQTDNTTPPAK